VWLSHVRFARAAFALIEHPGGAAVQNVRGVQSGGHIHKLMLNRQPKQGVSA
jgi:hypothetical protein